MAGSYMDAPAHRLAFDRDGSFGIGITNSGVLTALTGTELTAINSEAENATALPGNSWQFAVIFPVPIDIAAVFLALSAANAVSVWTSKNTTTGLDGTWTQRTSAASALRDVKPNYRMSSQLLSIPGGAESVGVVGVKVVGTASLPSVRALHVYGDPNVSATPDRLAIWHPTLDQPISPSYFDWGNAPRSSSADKSFRVKNLSGTLTAEDIELYVDALTPGTPSVASMHAISDNGGSTFLPSVSITSLTPGEISDVFILRRTIPSNALVSVWSARVGVDVGEWT